MIGSSGSKSENDADYHVRTWDLDLVDKTNDWILTLEGSETAEGMAEAFFAENDHGTVVLMEKLDRLIPSDMDVKKINDYFLKCIESVEEKTTLYFSEFMDGKNKIDFYINGSLVKSWDPFYTSHKLTIINPEERLHFKGETIRVQSYILPHSSKLSDEELEEGGLNNNWTDLQGFYVYRNNRLLVAGEWLLEGLVKRDIYKLARIRIDLPNNLDEEWGIDVRKSIVTPPVQLQEQLRRIANAARKKSGEIYKHRGKVLKRASKYDQTLVWNETKYNDSYQFKVNRNHPLIADALKNSEDRKQISSIIKLIEETIPVAAIVSHSSEDNNRPYRPYSQDKQLVDELMNSFIEALQKIGKGPDEIVQIVSTTEPFSDYSEKIALLKEILEVNDL